MNNRIIFKKLI